MRLLAWNIRAGGGTRLSGILSAIAAHDADLLVLSEYHPGEAGARLRAALCAAGFPHQSRAEPSRGRKGVLVVARRRFRELPPDLSLPEPSRLVTVAFGTLHVIGVYMPNLLAKVPYWEALLTQLAPHGPGRAVALGDFNTCRPYLDEAGRFDRTGYFMDRIDALGFHDLWRRRNPEGREYSWYSHRQNGFRIDHAFLSPHLARRAGPVRYSHTERLAGLSDHSPLLLDLRKGLRPPA